MIRINLLAVERERVRRRPGLDLSQQITVLGSLLVLVAALGVVWWWWTLRQRVARLDRDIAAAQQETVRLKSVLDELRRMETRRTQFQQRVALIEELRRGQGVAVRLLDQVSRSVPDRLWLTELRQEGSSVTMQGRAISLTALSDFVGNLEASGYFARPVEILESTTEEQQQVQVVRFSIKAEFKVPGP